MLFSRLPDGLYYKLIISLNIFYLIFTLSIIRASRTPLDWWVAVLLTVSVNLLFNFGVIKINFFVYNQDVSPKKKAISDKTLRELNNPDSSPFVTNKQHEKVTVDGKEVRLYPIQSYKFNLDTIAHTMVVGSTGSAKSTLTFTLLKMLQDQYRPKFVICDAGNYDFAQALAYKRDDITKVIDLVYRIMEGRQATGSRDDQRIILVIEEAESYFREVSLLPKQERDAALGKLAALGTLARKSKINMLMIGQMSKAVTIPSEIRGNFGGRWLARMPKNISANSFGCSYSLEDLETGVIYNNNTNSFFSFPLVKEPKLDVVKIEDLERLVKYYENRQNG